MKFARICSLTLLFLSGITYTSNAQQKNFSQRSSLSAGPEFAVPVGDFGDVYKYGIGGTVKYLFNITNTYGLTLQSGAIYYVAKAETIADPNNPNSFYTSNPDFTSIPVKLGGQFRYKSVFAEPQLGLTWFAGEKTRNQSASTTYGINIGTYICKHLVLSGNFERWNRGGFGASHAAVRVAYAFHFKN